MESSLGSGPISGDMLQTTQYKSLRTVQAARRQLENRSTGWQMPIPSREASELDQDPQ